MCLFSIHIIFSKLNRHFFIWLLFFRLLSDCNCTACVVFVHMYVCKYIMHMNRCAFSCIFTCLMRFQYYRKKTEQKIIIINCLFWLFEWIYLSHSHSDTSHSIELISSIKPLSWPFLFILFIYFLCVLFSYFVIPFAFHFASSVHYSYQIGHEEI